MLLITLCLASAAEGAFTAKVLDLSDNELVVQTPHPMRINNLGEVIGSVLHRFDDGEAVTSVVWKSPDKYMVIAGTSGYFSVPFDINDRSEVVGLAFSYDEVGGSGSYGAGYVKRPDSDIQYTPFRVQPFSGKYPTAINDASTIASQDFSGLIVESAGISRRVSIPFGSEHAHALNRYGQMVGTYDYPRNGQWLGMFYDDGQTVHTYTSLFGMEDVRGYDLTDDGVVVGTAILSLPQQRAQGYPSAYQRAFILRDGTAVILPIGEFDLNSWAYAINESESIVGFVRGGSGNQAALWMHQQLYDLNELTLDLPASLRLYEAHDINDHGQIVAVATDGVYSFPVLLTPVTIPEPGGVFGLALMGAWAMRRRRSSDLKFQI